MLITVRATSSSPLSFISNLSPLDSKASPRLRTSICRASCSVPRKPSNSTNQSWNLGLLSYDSKGAVFDPLRINPDVSGDRHDAWESFVALLTPTFESASSTKKDKPSSRGLVAAIKDSSIDFGDFFKGPL
ncbi:hypothetical protein SLE2022_151210 [Rubroshorea leprosula]